MSNELSNERRREILEDIPLGVHPAVAVYIKSLNRLFDERDNLRQSLKLAVEALEVYARLNDSVKLPTVGEYTSSVNWVAREALSKIKKDEK